jgi:hypothetical protein
VGLSGGAVGKVTLQVLATCKMIPTLISLDESP